MNPATFSERKKAAQAALGSAPPTTLPESMGQWLGALTLLEDIPFVYLVPNAQMLPLEALRFFYMDRNWLDSLVDGAFSVGQYSTRDALQFQQAAPTVRREAARHAARRFSVAAGTGTPPDTPDDPDGIMSGFLLRSSVVAAYPGMQVKGYADTQGQNPLPLLRLETLGADVMIAIWVGVPMRVDFAEPPHGLQFGGVPVASDPPGWNLALRSLVTGEVDGSPASPGQEIEVSDGQQGTEPVWVTVPWRSPDTRVVDIGSLVSSLQEKLLANGAMAGNTLTPQGFAIQLVVSAESQTFMNSGS